TRSRRRGKRTFRTEANGRWAGMISSSSALCPGIGTRRAIGRARSMTSIISPASAARRCFDRLLLSAEIWICFMTHCGQIWPWRQSPTCRAASCEKLGWGVSEQTDDTEVEAGEDHTEAEATKREGPGTGRARPKDE